MASDDRMVDDWWIAKNLEGGGRGLFELLSRNFPIGSEENHEKSVSAVGVPALDSNWALPEYKSIYLTLHYLVWYVLGLCSDVFVFVYYNFSLLHTTNTNNSSAYWTRRHKQTQLRLT
jgi:hypothetical protein